MPPSKDTSSRTRLDRGKQWKKSLNGKLKARFHSRHQLADIPPPSLLIQDRPRARATGETGEGKGRGVCLTCYRSKFRRDLTWSPSVSERNGRGKNVKRGRRKNEKGRKRKREKKRRRRSAKSRGEKYFPPSEPEGGFQPRKKANFPSGYLDLRVPRHL